MIKKFVWLIIHAFALIGLYQVFLMIKRISFDRNIIVYEKLEKLTFQDLKNGEWQTLENKGNIVYFHRAIYDTRKFDKWSSPCVTMFVLSNTQETKDLEDIICGYTFFNKTIKRKTRVILTDQAYRWPETHLQEFVVQCPVNGIYPIPTYVFVEREKKQRATLKIERPYSGRYNLGICVPVVYGSFDPDMLIEWFEFHKFFGIEFFDITLWNVNKKVLKIFKHYEKNKEAMLNLVDIPFQVRLDNSNSELNPSKKPYFLKAFMPIALNECYLMNSLRAKYIISMDFDEFLYINNVKYRNYHNFMQRFDYKGFANVIIGKINFDITCQLESKNLIERQTFIFKHSYRQPFKSMIVTDNPKSFSKPLNCPYIGNHFCVWNHEKTQYGYPRVGSKDVFIAHFRKKEECDEKILKTYEQDQTLNKLKELIIQRFKSIKLQILR